MTQTSTSSAPARGRRHRSARAPLPTGFWVIWSTVALDLVGFGIVVPILGRYAERFGAGGLSVGLLFAAFSLAQFVCAPLLGRLSDRIGRKPVLLISLLGTAIGSFVTGAANALWLLFIGRLIDGASGASVAVAQGAVTDMVSEDERPRALGLLGAAFGVGFIVGPAIGGLAALGGAHVPFFVAGGLAFTNAVVAVRRLPETRPRGERSRPTADTKVRLWGLASATFVAVCAFSGFEATFALLTKRRFGLTEAGVATVFIGIGLLLTVVQGGLIRRVIAELGADRTLQCGLVLNAAGLVVLAFAHRWSVLIPALVLLTFGQGLATPSLTMVVTGRVSPDRRGEALGFQQGISAIARVLGPAAAGALYQHVAIASPYFVGAALCGVSLVVLLGQVPANAATLHR